MNSIDGKILESHGVTVSDLYEGAFQIKMKAEQLTREGKDATDLYRKEYRIISSLVEMGDPASMILMGEMLQGRKLPEFEEDSVRKAMSLWQKAATRGEARGYTNIGLVYLHRSVPGGGNWFSDVEYDPEKAFECFLKGYEHGDSKAGRHVGLCYRDGLGTQKDEKMAYRYFCLAAERNDSTARYLKAECLYDGAGVEQNKEEALRIMRQLVEDRAHDADKAMEFITTHSV